MNTKDILASHPHVWIEVQKNPMKKPMWPPLTVGCNEYRAVLPRGERILVSQPLVDQIEDARRLGRPFVEYNIFDRLSAVEAHEVRLGHPEKVFPQSCLVAPKAPEPKKGK